MKDLAGSKLAKMSGDGKISKMRVKLWFFLALLMLLAILPHKNDAFTTVLNYLGLDVTKEFLGSYCVAKPKKITSVLVKDIREKEELLVFLEQSLKNDVWESWKQSFETDERFAFFEAGLLKSGPDKGHMVYIMRSTAAEGRQTCMEIHELAVSHEHKVLTRPFFYMYLPAVRGEDFRDDHFLGYIIAPKSGQRFDSPICSPAKRESRQELERVVQKIKDSHHKLKQHFVETVVKP